ncbi:hypothetical protein FPV67DRAFT_1530527 [Lyophyllum atratum]|nr:hypothetical protein FPV67DRAFT_1530527 [Lyophyllum atratum]
MVFMGTRLSAFWVPVVSSCGSCRGLAPFCNVGEVLRSQPHDRASGLLMICGVQGWCLVSTCKVRSRGAITELTGLYEFKESRDLRMKGI